MAKIVYKGSGLNDNKQQGILSNYLFENSLNAGITKGSFVLADQIRFRIINGNPHAGPTIVFETLAAINQFGLSRCSAGGPVSMYFNSDSPINSVVWNSSGSQVIGTAGGGTAPFIHGRSRTATSYTGPYTVVVNYSNGTTYTRLISSLFETVIPNATVNAGADQTRIVCASTYTFTISGIISSSPGTGIWSSPSGGVFSNASALSTTYTFSAADISNGSVVLTLTSVGYTCNGSDQIILRVPRPALANAGLDRTLCNVPSIILSGSRGGGATAAIWSGGTGTFSNVNALNSTYTISAAELLAGTVTLTLTAIGSACGSVSDQITLTYLPQISFSVVAPASSYCGASVNLTASSSTPSLVYTWVPQDGIGPILTGSPITTPSLTTNKTYIVAASISGNTCLVPVQTITVQVLNTPSIQVVGSSSVYCGQPFTLSINGTIPPSPPNTFQWKTSGTVVGTGTTFSATAPTNTSSTQTILYSLVLNGNNACVSNNVSVTLTSCVQTCNNISLSPAWATYFGGSEEDVIQDMDVDPITHDIVVAGFTGGGLPVTGVGSMVRYYNGPGLTVSTIPLPGSGRDAFVARISGDGATVRWITYIGGAGPDESDGIRFDQQPGSTSIYLTGTTVGSTFPTNVGLTPDNVGGTPYVCKLNGDGTLAQSSAYLNGFSGVSDGITVPENTLAGNQLFITGSYDTQISCRNVDLFVLRIDKTSLAVTAQGDFGGPHTDCPADNGNSIVHDANGNVYVGGSSYGRVADGTLDNSCSPIPYNVAFDYAQSEAPGLFFTNNTHGNTPGFYADAIGVKFNQAMVLQSWHRISTPLHDMYDGVALLPGGDVVFVGNYDYLPSTHPASSNKILVTRTDANLGGKEIHTYEGNGVEEGHGITTDDIGNVYISGQASSTDLHLSFGLPASYRSAFTGGPRDMYIARLSGTPLTPNWFTYYGSTGTGVGDDVSTTLAYDNVEKSLYAAGLTTSTNFEWVGVNAIQTLQIVPAGNVDGTIIKFGCNSNLPRPNNSNARIGINGFENDVEEEAILNKPTISLYPNPFADELSILVNGKTGNDYSVEIYDTKGLKLITISNVEENEPFSLTTKLGAGFYIVKVISDNFIETRKIEKFE